ncbi:Meiosis-specific serine/threonine-protein kinase mek1 [Zancudomyces culisetae]|uniref:Meiosis-specific serine/threonine-protein kinase mek1 n=1 Tax=Zancudomyces culisetae TaxID=1213189 RepID=A0A1R1PVK6_ZANCU|nr:Meiosis-specific serine/threonine-protein kinase mek1 [Zancudomyces culisetae]|eukprot:OMH84974.1 Meiosis-specific serine/threonine-protein kinase mek1 [Zancudomyces culisetae]
MPTYEDNIEYTQPTQPIEEFTQAVDEEQENGNDENIIGTLVRINGNLVQDYNLYLEKIVVIGRHRTCNIVVDSSYSSNKHCRVKVTKSPGTEDFVVVCEDLSSNGTLWNGKKIGKNNKVILTHGDTLEIKKGNYITFLLKSKYLKKKSEQDKQLDISSMYQITDTELGSGTFAKVKLAIRKDTQEQVAVKIMDKANNRNPGSIGGGTNYIDEVNLLRAFDHPNIVRVFDVLETEKQVYIFMPL